MDIVGRDRDPLPISQAPIPIHSEPVLDPLGIHTRDAVGDLDGDNDLDLAISGWYNYAVVLLNNGNATFATAVDYPLVPGPVAQNGARGIALGDLDRAVELSEQNHTLYSETLAKRPPVLDLREFKLTIARQAENVAVIRYHRSLVYDKLGESAKAEEDRRRVRELGFEPNEDLF